MQKSLFSLTLLIIIAFAQVFGQDSTNVKIKKGWTFGVLPSVAYDSDLGFKYGGLVNLYYFGDGSTYPNYLHSIRVEINRTTKGSGVNQLFYDSDRLFKDKKIRLTADVSFLTEKALDFYGFNGSEAYYNNAWEDDNSDEYISRIYYRHERQIFRAYADFQGKIKNDKFRWLGGLGVYDYKIGSVDIDKLNKGKDEEDKLPDTLTLYDHYVNNGLISQAEADGGFIKYLKAGLIFDSRDIEANPSKGIWSEAILLTAPRFLGNTENAFTRLSLTHRQYFTILKDRLTFVYRLGYQTTINGNTPFYFQPLTICSYSPSNISEGIGGAKSVRGILRNRIVGDGYAYSNFEFRYKIAKFIIGKQNIYVALNPFLDAGKITKRIDFGEEIPDEIIGNFTDYNDKFHFSTGCGLHIALNENFILAITYGRALDKQDGVSGFYINTNWLF